jgi:hypothetical protein
MSRKIAPSEAKAQEHTALLQGQTTVASDEELLNAWCELPPVGRTEGASIL